MLLKLRALWFFIRHPHPVSVTIVRRYVDAQKHFIGELYLGEGREAKMIGMSCDNLPFNLGEFPNSAKGQLEFRYTFLDRMSPNTIRVGALVPEDNAKVQTEVGLRQFCPVSITVLNRFIEHVLESQHG